MTTPSPSLLAEIASQLVQEGVKISKLPAATQANATDQFEANQGGVTRRLTASQISALVQGDVAVSGIYVTDGELSAALALKANIASPAFTGTPSAPTVFSGSNNNQQIANIASVVNFASQFYAPLASPTFTGDPKSVTMAFGDNDTSIATTAFVQAAVAPKAPLASPVFTGDPRAVTMALGDNDTSIATTAFVQAQLTATLGNYLPVSNPTFAGVLTGPNITLNTPTVANRLVQFQTNGVLRWLIGVPNVAESGGNAGSNFVINRYSDAGAFIDTPFQIGRADGQITTSASLKIGASANRTVQANVSGGNLSTFNVRYDDNGAPFPLLLQNGGITGINQGVGIHFQLGTGGAPGGAGGALYMRSLADFSTAANQDAEMVGLAAYDGSNVTVFTGRPGAFIVPGTLNFNGVAATDAMLKRSGANTLQARLGNDSAYALMEALTPTAGDNTNRVATTAFVANAVVAANPLNSAFNVRTTVGDTWNGATSGNLFRSFTAPVEDYDPNGVWDNATGIFTAASAGRYHFACASYGTMAGGPAQWGVVIQHQNSGGAAIRSYCTIGNGNGTEGADKQAQADIQMAAGDRVAFLVVSQGAGGNSLGIAATGTVASGAVQLTWACGHRIG